MAIEGDDRYAHSSCPPPPRSHLVFVLFLGGGGEGGPPPEGWDRLKIQVEPGVGFQSLASLDFHITVFYRRLLVCLSESRKKITYFYIPLTCIS